MPLSLKRTTTEDLSKFPGVYRGTGLGIVVEIDVHVAPLLQIIPDSPLIDQQLVMGIAAGVAPATTMSPEVDKICRRRKLGDKVRPVSHAEGNAILTTERYDL